MKVLLTILLHFSAKSLYQHYIYTYYVDIMCMHYFLFLVDICSHLQEEIFYVDVLKDICSYLWVRGSVYKYANILCEWQKLHLLEVMLIFGETSTMIFGRYLQRFAEHVAFRAHQIDDG